MAGINNTRKQLTINLVANIVSYSANIIISFILTPFLISVLGKETYSFFPMANTIVSYLSVLTNAMNTAASRFVSVSLVQDEKEEANKYYSSTLAANLIMSGVLVVLMSVMIIFLDRFMDVPINSAAAIRGLFALVFASALINVSAAVFGIATFAKNRIDLRSLRELVTAVLRLLLFFVLYKFLPPSIIYVGVVTLVVAFVNICFQIVYTRKLLPEIGISKRYVSWQHTKQLLSTSCWTAINTFGSVLLVGMSMILANMLYGAEASGTFSIVNTVPQFINGVINMLVGVFYPIITYKYAQKDRVGLILEIRNAQNMVGVFGCAVIAVFSALSAEFFVLWMPGEDASYLSWLTIITIFPHMIISCLWVLTNLNVVMNKVKIPALFTLFIGIANIVITLLVYKVYNPSMIMLPVISTVLQVIWVGGVIPLYASSLLKEKWYVFYPPLFKGMLASAIIMTVIMNVKQYVLLNSWMKLLVYGGFCGVMALGVLSLVMIGRIKMVNLIKQIRMRFSKINIYK